MAVERDLDFELKLTPEDVWSALDVEEPEPEEGKRVPSGIQFPYGDLNDAVEVTRAIYAHVGSSTATWEQLAGWLGYAAVSSGAFRTKVATARIFGLTETKTGGAALTTLGLRIVDPTRERAARATAFLNVPLFRALYDQHLGMTLPPDAGLEHEMESLGVSPRQKVRARQIFQRSADQAGFFGLGRNKLVFPQTEYAPPQPTPPREEAASEAGLAGIHPLLTGLLHALPEPGCVWPGEKRRTWLATAEHIFHLLYSDETAG